MHLKKLKSCPHIIFKLLVNILTFELFIESFLSLYFYS